MTVRELFDQLKYIVEEFPEFEVVVNQVVITDIDKDEDKIIETDEVISLVVHNNKPALAFFDIWDIRGTITNLDDNMIGLIIGPYDAVNSVNNEIASSQSIN